MIRSEYKADGPRQGREARGHAVRRVIWIIGIVALATLLAYKLLPWSQGRHTSPEVSKAGTQIERAKGLAYRQTDIPGEKQSSTTSAMGESSESTSGSFWGSRATARDTRRSQPPPSYADAHQLMTELAQMKPRGTKFSQEEINEINRLIQNLKRQGRAGVMAIQEFLESGQDVSFADYKGKTPPAYSSLRLAMIDALAQMGEQEATAFMASMLHATTNPEEIAYLSKGLELSAPGVYRAEILNTVLTMLNQTLMNTSVQYPGLGHLFGVIQDYGDKSLAVPLENIYRKSPSVSAEFALMALSKLPEGDGIPTLIKIANEMSGDPGAYGTRYDVALRMLTQASREYPEAEVALLKLGTTNKLGTAVLIRVAATLGGTEHQLITKSSSVSQLSKAEVFINGRAAETWSDAEIDQRLVLIDQLLRTNPQPSAVKALQDARNRLLVWKQRPMVGGKRIKQ